MDILDIDEALKDDSYIFLADKTHDDISNILQQWKTNNQQQPPQSSLQLQPHLHYNNHEQAYKHNSKTFTRPKRRSQAATNLETQFNATTSGMLSLEIGGLVTTMHKSFLQDTSPPSSICSSMNNEHMNNSLISSADFTNLNFLQSTNSLDPNEDATEASTQLNLTTTTTLTNEADVYTLSDMIRDRKALESLTMSGDGTLIKDSHIGQIDDISLTTLSKTASGCSTMDNSTDSVSTGNELQLQQQTQHLQQQQQLQFQQQQLRSSLLLSEDMIGDTTFSLVDSLTTPTTADSMCELEVNATFKRPQALPLNETLLLAGRQVNTTYTELSDTPEASRCETPENVDKTLSTLQMESTPLTTNTGSRLQLYNLNKNHNNNNNNNINHNNNNNNKQLSYTPKLKERGEIDNISPIVSHTTPQRGRQFQPQPQLNHTYEQPTAMLKDLQLEAATMELLDQIEQPPLDATYNMTEEQKQMQCILDLAEAEVEMLAQQGDEEQFENMLAELGKMNSLNAEQIKMQKSLDSIKRRFNRDEEQHQPSQQQLHHNHQHHHHATHSEALLEEDHVQHVTPPSMHQTQLLSHSHNQSQSSASGSGERLLSRRSRLYDDVNLSAMHDSNVSGGSSCNSTSFIVHRRDDETAANTSEACTPLQESEEPEAEQQPEKEQEQSAIAVETEASSYKLTERRERDRERFKTIKITKEMRARDEQLDNHIVVPCIDDEETLEPPQMEMPEPVEQHRQTSPPGRLSRRDQSAIGESSSSSSSVSASNNYLTYKKPKEKSLLMRQRQQQQQVIETPANESSSQGARSLSRPRYISGLQKFTTVSKATSAGAGLNGPTMGATGAEATSAAKKGTTPGELKSPMGIKSKSFHNLSSNISGIVGPGAASLAPRPSLGGALRRPGVQSQNRLMSGPRPAQQQEQEDTSVFKVPKLVSGLRAPSTAGAKRAVGNGLARPSSGYYSLSMRAAGESETPESLSSASSRGSLYGKETKLNQNFDTQVLSSKLTQVTTGATGIPKPSGLRPPTQVKRSGLPRPSSIVRR
ncbi:uncharacterized protein DDB_G0288805 isoform X1 [Drosophila nasuta]|uniref:uncharacterized protein DDB_G0288805 isoform X1 n=1 Tax=Drosophila nasuta TaxID=42062 RepID=UPI00295F5A78|nr:uncharacterized protein DDB_G0288805 isoform X1 [Drosophila nasuta]